MPLCLWKDVSWETRTSRSLSTMVPQSTSNRISRNTNRDNYLRVLEACLFANVVLLLDQDSHTVDDNYNYLLIAVSAKNKQTNHRIYTMNSVSDATLLHDTTTESKLMMGTQTSSVGAWRGDAVVSLMLVLSIGYANDYEALVPLRVCIVDE